MTFSVEARAENLELTDVEILELIVDFGGLEERGLSALYRCATTPTTASEAFRCCCTVANGFYNSITQVCTHAQSSPFYLCMNNYPNLP